MEEFSKMHEFAEKFRFPSQFFFRAVTNYVIGPPFKRNTASISGFRALVCTPSNIFTGFHDGFDEMTHILGQNH